MSLGVSSGDLIGSWSLSFSDIAFVTGKAETARLGLAVQLRFFAGHGFFVPDHASIPSDGVLYLAEQLGLDAKSVNHYDFSGRTARRHCAEILRHLGFRRMTQTDRRALSRWISDDLCAGGQPINAMLEHVFLWCRDRRIYGPSRKELERLVRSQRHLYLEALLARVRDRLAPDAVALLEASLADPDGPTGFNTMKGDAGQATLENILGVTAKLAFIQRLALPRDFLSVTGKAWVDQIARAGVTFRYTENGPEGLLNGKKAVVAFASGGVPMGAAMDHVTPYLKTVLGFVGITDVEFLDLDGFNARFGAPTSASNRTHEPANAAA